MKTFKNVFQPDLDELRSEYLMKGNWSKKYFGNTNPIVLELGCGMGEYTVALAKKYPNAKAIMIAKNIHERLPDAAELKALQSGNNVIELTTIKDFFE